MNDLLFFYANIIGYPTIGYILKTLFPTPFSSYAYQFMLWVSTPMLIFIFCRNNILNNIFNDFWIIPLISLTAISISAIFMWIIADLGYINERISFLSSTNKFNQNSDFKTHNLTGISSLFTDKNSEIQSSLIMNGIIGNTSYIAFPIILLILDSTQTQYFTWAIVFNLFNSTLISYFIFIISYRLLNKKIDFELLVSPLKTIFRNQIFWALVAGYFISPFIHFERLEHSINQFRYVIICVNLVAIGTQFSFPKSQFMWNQAFTILLVKMLITPLVISALLISLNITSFPIIIILLQVAMPPLVLRKEIYKQSNLSKNLNIVAHSIGCALLVFTVPIWVTLSR